uniref:Transposase n=1 Tax=Candidatus Kentrum sp. LPFa TaxID=2126335 RepID=A0A450Y4U7_9GAMM|nr:MAG: hypothetical protein BECKLPF1236A_GA0070988_105132 [Candidatus Kentron sp. LPFa]VFK36537.1 MAG: hypothetical protein BECKLPF1236C_GA0070990_106312 [Candidatus Kentron sp. LPFa]
MRDLTRTRDDFKAQEQKARQQLNAFVLRHGRHWPTDKTRWTRTHYNWLESLTFEHPWLQTDSSADAQFNRLTGVCQDSCPVIFKTSYQLFGP